MQDNYYIEASDVEADTETAADRLKIIKRLLSTSTAQLPVKKQSGRNLLTRSLDWFFGAARLYVPPLYRIGAAIIAFVVFLYARLVALTVRLMRGGHLRWPDIPAPCVLVLWHGDAPSFLVAFATRRPDVDLAILISFDARGDFLALLCRLLGFTVVRGGGTEHGWEVLIDLARKIEEGACVILTADGGGPAHVVRVGALALASATRVPLVPLSANCHPAIVERRKWDAARNPVPFAKIAVALGEARMIGPLSNLETIEENRRYLQSALEELSIETRQILGL
jgi:lysophospholipid acyltransferase (LPLAT)-like uncharacterized protein